jgi:RNA polymerase sigma-70 factor, ECF subfamily
MATANGSTTPENPCSAGPHISAWGRSGDELVLIYRDNAPKVQSFFGFHVSHETAEDLTAATFERVVKWWSRYDPEAASARTWIRAIARNVLADHFRRQSHRNAISLDASPSLAASLVAEDDPGARVLSLDAVRDWFRWLEPREREVLALRIAFDWSAAEVARHLELSEANVHQISSRAIRRLQLQVPSSHVPRIANGVREKPARPEPEAVGNPHGETERPAAEATLPHQLRGRLAA